MKIKNLWKILRFKKSNFMCATWIESQHISDLNMEFERKKQAYTTLSSVSLNSLVASVYRLQKSQSENITLDALLTIRLLNVPHSLPSFPTS